MLAIPAQVRIFLCTTPVSMRKNFEGLSKIVEELFKGELLTGALFVFLNRTRTHMKILSWDGETLEQYPLPLIDHGFSKRIRCDAYPAFYMVNPYEDWVVPVGAGLLSVTQLKQNTEQQFKN